MRAKRELYRMEAYMLEIKNLSKGYDGREVLHQLNMKVERGEIHGLIGENGCGKTTLMKCITGIFKPETGEVTFEGEPVFENPSVKARIGYVADDNPYFPRYRLGKMVTFFGRIYPDFDVEKIKYMNEVFKLDMNRRVSELSKGQKMRLAFMLNNAANTELLVMDEPTAGVDAVAKKELFEMLIREVENRGLTVLITSHNLLELEKVCDSMTIMKAGRITADNQIDEVKGEVRKFNFVFADGVPDGFLSQQGMVHYSNVGNIYTVIFRDKEDAEIEGIKEMYHPVYTEELSVDLEEVFIYTHGGERDEK